jgi:DNA invertase Pin-like site-specific DNA recombinase
MHETIEAFLCQQAGITQRAVDNFDIAYGAGSTKIYREKVTGAHSDRRQLLKKLDAVAPGDVVTVTRIDLLARSTFDLFGIVKRIVDAKAQFRSLAEP